MCLFNTKNLTVKTRALSDHGCETKAVKVEIDSATAILVNSNYQVEQSITLRASKSIEVEKINMISKGTISLLSPSVSCKDSKIEAKHIYLPESFINFNCKLIGEVHYESLSAHEL